MSTFFGLTQQYKKLLHENIYAMIKMGGGGWTWKDIYTMPIHLRMFYMSKLSESIDKENAQMASAAVSKKHSSTSKVSRPEIMRSKNG